MKDDQVARPYDDYIRPLLSIIRERRADSLAKANEHRHAMDAHIREVEAYADLIDCIDGADEDRRQRFSYLSPFIHAGGVFEPDDQGMVVAFLTNLGSRAKDDKTLLKDLLDAIYDDYVNRLR